MCHMRIIEVTQAEYVKFVNVGSGIGQNRTRVILKVEYTLGDRSDTMASL